jgi:hypothetical protein
VEEADTEWYEGYLIQPEPIDYLPGMYQAEATYTGKQTVHGIGQGRDAAVADAKHKIDALHGRGGS